MNLLVDKLEEIALLNFGDSSLYGLKGSPIQESKLVNVRTTHGIDNEDIYFIYDATLFGSAKDGIVFASEGIYWKDRLASPNFISYKGIIRSTASVDLYTDYLYEIDKGEGIKIREILYNFISQLRLELVRSFKIYEDYYREAIDDFIQSLVELEEAEEFNRLINRFNKYEGLFLDKKDRPLKLYKILFKAYIKENKFTLAGQSLEDIKYKDPLFYKDSIPVLRLGIQEAEILDMIYSYNFKQAKEAIDNLPNAKLAQELKETLNLSNTKLYKDIQNAARSRDYGYFESFGQAFNFRDGSGMSALEYFALEADIKGMLMALRNKDLILLHYNIYGHNFIDLLGLACDPRFGAKPGNYLEILNKLNKKVDIKLIEDRINYINTGQEGRFFSHNMPLDIFESLNEDEVSKLRTARLEELNDRLMSPDYFRYKANEIENQENNSVNKIIKRLFGNELEDMDNYPEKEEFESSSSYYKRCLNFKQQYLKRKDFIDEYKRQNPNIVEEISKTLDNKEELFESSLSVLKSLQEEKELIRLYNFYFPLENPEIKLLAYDYDKEYFYILVDDKLRKISIEVEEAKELRESYKDMETIVEWEVERDIARRSYKIKFKDKIYTIK